MGDWSGWHNIERAEQSRLGRAGATHMRARRPTIARMVHTQIAREHEARVGNAGPIGRS